MTTRVVKLGGVPVGGEHPTVFFAEIGSFFNGDYELARRMIKKVIDAGRSVPDQPMVLKTEILDDAEICLPGETMETYTSKDGRIYKENYRELIERKMMATEHYIPLFALLVEEGVPFVVSVYDFNAVDLATNGGAAALKIASSNVVHVPLIRYAASKGLPMVIDTGRSSIAEVYRAVATARAAGCHDIIVQHSPDGHPATPAAHNLNILRTYERAFGLPTGLSDHHVGLEMLYMSIALGASVLEKGVYTDPDELDQDISHTMHIDELPRVLAMCRDCWRALGSFERDPEQVITGVIGTSQRQCLVAARDLEPGAPVDLTNVRFAFPCMGIPVEEWDRVEGWKLTQSIKAGTPIGWGDVRGGHQ